MEQLIGYIKYFVIPFFLFLTSSLIVILLFKRIRYQLTLPYRSRIIRKSEVFLTEITLSKPDKNTLNYKISEFKSEIPLHRNWCKEMLIDDMIRMKSNLKGKTAKNILAIYKQLELNRYSARLIRDFRKYKKCTGFYHFQALGYTPGILMIKKYLLHPNKIILSNANIAFLALSKGNWLALDKIPVKVSRITTIKVMDVLHSENIPMPKDIDFWIHSKNKAILKLAVMTMVFYNYRNKSAEIIKLLNHEHKALRTDVIIAIRELFLYEAEDELLSILPYETRDTQIEILETLAVIGTKKTITFLENEIPKQEIKDVKLKMVFCYNNIDTIGIDKIGLKDPDTQKMINHIRKIEL
ncbi:hypothetical protein [Flavobacterium sp. KACC 22761]|uniref:hypothetical protein n=1 Tax=Flavobacterium sp. KACC 22761 TaxID=3092665 RepID=UPI002A754127|nr:hypothetical protein [Flavobacterium sp. KACC 22761]WPO77382.1 hypothetical protein SCB73_14020 [Flavobacterium sp. KACC 22761]